MGLSYRMGRSTYLDVNCVNMIYGDLLSEVVEMTSEHCVWMFCVAGQLLVEARRHRAYYERGVLLERGVVQALHEHIGWALAILTTLIAPAAACPRARNRP